MNLGAEPKKVAILAVLLTVAGGLIYTNIIAPDDGSASASTTPAAPVPQPVAPRPGNAAAIANLAAPTPARRSSNENQLQEFRPSLKPRNPEERVDPAKIDPTLRLDLLAALSRQEAAGGSRNVFEFGAAPPPKVPDVKIIPQTKPAAAAPAPPPPPTPSGPPPKPQAPPIPMKYYGFLQAKASGALPRRGFFIRGEDIFVAGEGELIERRYKVVRFNADSVVMEDTQFEGQQTLRLEQPPNA